MFIDCMSAFQTPSRKAPSSPCPKTYPSTPFVETPVRMRLSFMRLTKARTANTTEHAICVRVIKTQAME